MNTAVLPIPALAWHITSIPVVELGMHFYWTSDGCSKAQSSMALFISGFRSMSLKLEIFTSTKVVGF